MNEIFYEFLFKIKGIRYPGTKKGVITAIAIIALCAFISYACIYIAFLL